MQRGIFAKVHGLGIAPNISARGVVELEIAILARPGLGVGRQSGKRRFISNDELLGVLHGVREVAAGISMLSFDPLVSCDWA